MKIISKFSDYYDVGLAYGIDKNIRFERVTKIIHEDDEDSTNDSITLEFKKNSKNYTLIIQEGLITFCGEFYPFAKVTVYLVMKHNKKLVYEKKSTLLSYKKEEIVDFIEQEYASIEEIEREQKYSYMLNDSLDSIFYSDSSSGLVSVGEVPYYVDTYEGLPYQERFVIYQLPILAKYHFFDVVPPMEAFQKLSMFLGAINSKDNNMVEIEDRYLAEGKGFDCYSFKKRPKKRKRKKC